MHIIFVRGLNTYNDNRLHFGPITLGPVYKPLKEAFQKRGVPMTPLMQLGSGSIEQQAINGAQELSEFLKSSISNKWILVGHSMGGLVIKKMLTLQPELMIHIKAIITLATPHGGSQQASEAIRHANQTTTIYKILKWLKYDLNKRLTPILDLTPEKTKNIEFDFQKLNFPNRASISFSVTPQQMSWPCKVTYHLSKNKNVKSDGFIEQTSQIWSHHIAEIPLDHICQLGFFYYLQEKKRTNAMLNFDRLLDLIIQYGRTLK